MRKQPSNRLSLSSRLSKDSEDGKGSSRPPSKNGSLKHDGRRRISKDENRSGSRLSRYSNDSRSLGYDEERASFYESCKTAYLMVFDDTKDDITSPEELMLLFQYSGQNPTNKAISDIWTGFRDSITFYQFCDMLKEEKSASKEELTKAFKKIDVNGDGFVSHKELRDLLTMHGEPMTKSEIKLIMEDADYNGDGKLDYSEFCDMMLLTADKCARLHKDRKLTDNSKTWNGSSTGKRLSLKERKSALKQEEENSVPLEEKRPYASSTKSKRLKDSFNKGSENSSLEANMSKVVKEPSDLYKWRYKSTKGYFCLEDDGSIGSHHYRLLVLESTDIFITMQPLTPKYGKFCSELADSDVSVFLLQEGRQGKLIGFTESKIEQKYCLHASVGAGSYHLLTFTSGVTLRQTREDADSQSKLTVGEDDNAKLTKACRESLYEVFYRCDLDGNGFLSRKEFSLFQLKTSEEDCDDDAWSFLKENFEMNNKDEITPEGFLKLCLMEAKEDVEELWITLKTMGYNNGLELTKAFPFQIEVFTRKGDCAIETGEMNDGGKQLENSLMHAVKLSATQRPFKDNSNIILYTSRIGARATLAVENKTYAPVKIRLLCNKSRNTISRRGILDYTCDLEAKDFQIVDHLVPKKAKQDMKIVCEEFLLT